MAVNYDVIIIGGGHNGLVERRLPGARRAQGAGARAPPCARRRGRHRRDLSGLQVLGLLVRRLAAAAGDHPRARSAAPRPRDPAARRHVHADAERRLPVARERSRARRAARLRGTRKLDAEAYDEYGKAMVEMGRFVKPILGMTPPDPTSLDPRGLMKLLFLGRRFQQLADRRQVQPGPADDDERGRFSRSVVRDRRAQGDDVGVGHHRHVSRRALARARPTCCCITTWARSTAPSARGDSARGGTGAISNAIADAAREAGVEIRTRGAGRRRSSSRTGRRSGVVLDNGDEI